MDQAAANTPSVTEKLARLAREIVGVLAGGLLGSIAWTVISHQTFSRGWSDQDFPEALGELRGGELTDIPRLGLWTGLLAGVVLAIVVLPVAYRLVKGRWYVQALPLAAAAFLLWGLWFSPAIGDTTSFPGGAFGSDAGFGTALSYVAAALGYGLVAGRVYSVSAARDFWQPQENDLREQGAEVMSELGLDDATAGVRMDGEASLELPEEGFEQPRETPRS